MSAKRKRHTTRNWLSLKLKRSTRLAGSTVTLPAFPTPASTTESLAQANLNPVNQANLSTYLSNLANGNAPSANVTQVAIHAPNPANVAPFYDIGSISGSGSDLGDGTGSGCTSECSTPSVPIAMASDQNEVIAPSDRVRDFLQRADLSHFSYQFDYEEICEIALHLMDDDDLDFLGFNTEEKLRFHTFRKQLPRTDTNINYTNAAG